MIWDFGKTIQVITLLLDYVQQEEHPKPSMVISPSSLCLNWENEIQKFAPTLKKMVIHGKEEERREQLYFLVRQNKEEIKIKLF